MVVYTRFEGDALKAFEDMVGIVWAEAQRQQGLTEDDLTIRDLLPKEDMGLADEDWLFTSTTTLAATITYFLVTIDTARFLGINAIGFGAGAIYPTTPGGAAAAGTAQGASVNSLRNITQIKVTRGGKVLRRWQVQPWVQQAHELAGNGLFVLWMDDPVTCFQRIPLQIDVIKGGQAADRFAGITATIALLGRAVEPEGKVVNRNEDWNPIAPIAA